MLMTKKLSKTNKEKYAIKKCFVNGFQFILDISNYIKTAINKTLLNQCKPLKEKVTTCIINQMDKTKQTSRL